MANGKEPQLRRQEPIDLLKQMDETVEQSMIQNTSPQTDSYGRVEYKEGQIPGKDILRPHEQKFFDHYENEYANYADELYGPYRDDRVLTYKFLEIVEEDSDELSYKDKVYANKLIQFDKKLQDRTKTLKDKIRFDSKSRVPTQMDKYPKSVLTKEEVSELRSLRRKIEGTELFKDMKRDQDKLNWNARARRSEKERKLEGKTNKTITPEYKSKYKFTVGERIGKWHGGGEAGRREVYEGKAPSMYNLEEKYRKGFYSQYQKPKVGMMERIMHKLRGGDEALIK